MALKKCVGCGIPLGSDAKYCPQCGMTQPEECKCAHCGAAVQAGMCFCPECGQAVSEGTTQQASQAQAPGVPSAPPTGEQPMPRPTNIPPLGMRGDAFGDGASAAGAAGALVGWKEKLLSFEGRLNRKPYVLRLLAVWFVSSIIVQIVSFILGLIIAKIAGSSAELGIVLLIFLYAVIFVLYIPATVISISLEIRRCHDNDWSGWLVLLGFVPLANIVLELLPLFTPGTPGPNRFGPDPLQ